MGKRKVAFRLLFPNRNERTTSEFETLTLHHSLSLPSESCEGYANLAPMSIAHLAIQHTQTLFQVIFIHHYQHKFSVIFV